MEQSWRMWWTVCSASFGGIAECRVHDASSFQVHSHPTVSCSQPEYSGVLMSCQMVDWVCRGVVVHSGPSPLAFLFRSRVLASRYMVVGRKCSCLLPDLARRSALSFPGTPQWAGIHCGTTMHSCGRSCRSFSSWWTGWSEVLEIWD